MLIVSWRRWASPVADSGREMDLPLRLLGGELLYRDVHYLYPPLSPYLNAQLYRWFGTHLDVLQASGILCAAIIVVLCYRIARRLLPPSAAALAGVAVIVFCVFKPAGNLISPYAFAALHGMLLALGTLLLMLRYGESRQKRELLFAGIAVGLAAITKQEFALTALVTVTAMLIYLFRTDLKQLAKHLSLVAMPAALIALPVYGLLLERVGWQTLVEDCHLLYTNLPSSLVFYNSQRTGLDRPLFSLMQMCGAAGVAGVIISAIILLSVMGANRQSAGDLAARVRRMIRWSSLALIISGLGALIVRAAAGGQWDGSPLRALPPLLLLMIVIYWRRGRSEKAALDRSLFIIASYSLAVLARVALRVPSGGAFGGFFLPTSLILICYLLLRALPDALGNQTQNPRIARRAAVTGSALLAATILVTSIVFAVRFRSNYDFEVRAPRGHLFMPRRVGEAVSDALDFIASQTAPGEAIVVVPEGSDLVFLSGRRSPLRHQILIPGLMSERDEQQAIARIEQERIRFVLIVNRPMREFGAEAFGRDFYQTLGKWIDEHYRLVRVCSLAPNAQLEIGDPQFFIKILARATSQAGPGRPRE
jgi:4-amino-4-deoxy-L-arabinose transferase-like glycosyltransferase